MQEALEGELGGSQANKENLFGMLGIQTPFCLILYVLVSQSRALGCTAVEMRNPATTSFAAFIVFYLCLPNQRLDLITKSVLGTAANNTVKSPKLFS